jgi:hypothetical protein
LANLNFRLTCQVQAQLHFKLTYLLKLFQYIFFVKLVKVAFAKLTFKRSLLYLYHLSRSFKDQHYLQAKDIHFRKMFPTGNKKKKAFNKSQYNSPKLFRTTILFTFRQKLSKKCFFKKI